MSKQIVFSVVDLVQINKKLDEGYEIGYRQIGPDYLVLEKIDRKSDVCENVKGESNG